MSIEPARDGYAEYYAEKIWELIPQVYRSEDGVGVGPNVLREIVETIAGQAAQARRSIDRLWEDQHIDSADDWAVPYIGDLLGVRPTSALDTRARRVEVGLAMQFRRRRGTPELLETMVRAMSGWDVVLIEGFRRLARTRHRLDGPPVVAGVFSRTPQGGTADLRSPAGAEISETAFDEFYHVPGAYEALAEPS